MRGACPCARRRAATPGRPVGAENHVRWPGPHSSGPAACGSAFGCAVASFRGAVGARDPFAPRRADSAGWLFPGVRHGPETPRCGSCASRSRYSSATPNTETDLGHRDHARAGPAAPHRHRSCPPTATRSAQNDLDVPAGYPEAVTSLAWLSGAIRAQPVPGRGRAKSAKEIICAVRRSCGRPPVSAEIAALIERLATQNHGWGYMSKANCSSSVTGLAHPPSGGSTKPEDPARADAAHRDDLATVPARACRDNAGCRLLSRGLRGDPPALVLLVRHGDRLPLRAHTRDHREPRRAADCAASATF